MDLETTLSPYSQPFHHIKRKLFRYVNDIVNDYWEIALTDGPGAIWTFVIWDFLTP